MLKCKTCKFYHICQGRLNETVNECARYKSVEQTNEEWLRSCSFNELARVLYCMIINGERIRPDLGYIKRWLKEKHE